MKFLIFLLAVLPANLLLAQNSPATASADRQQPRLISQKTNKPLTAKRQPVKMLKLANKKDKAKVIDFNIEHIDCGKLEIVFDHINFSEKQMSISVMNKGVLDSKQAYLAICIGAYTSGFLEKEQKPTLMYSSGKVVEPLKPNQIREYVFDITEGYNKIWANTLTQKIRDPYGYGILVTEPIVIK